MPRCRTTTTTTQRRRQQCADHAGVSSNSAFCPHTRGLAQQLAGFPVQRRRLQSVFFLLRQWLTPNSPCARNAETSRTVFFLETFSVLRSKIPTYHIERLRSTDKQRALVAALNARVRQSSQRGTRAGTRWCVTHNSVARWRQSPDGACLWLVEGSGTDPLNNHVTTTDGVRYRIPPNSALLPIEEESHGLQRSSETVFFHLWADVGYSFY